MKFLRKGRHVLTAAERHSLDKMIETCRLDKTGEKAKWAVYRLLNEAVRIGDINDFFLREGLMNLEIEYRSVVDKSLSSAVK